MITLLSLSVSGTLLLLLVLGLKPIYKNRFSRRWQYYIWIIVVLRFLLPVTSGDTLVGRLFEKLNATEITSASRTDINMTGITNIDYRVQDDTPINTIPQAETIQHASSGLKMYLFAVWLTIASALFIRNITIYQDFTRYVRAGNKEVSDIHILNILSDCEEKLNIKARVQLYQNAMIVSPILIGFFHPCILLPMEEVGNKELSYIFTHELIHYRKKDMFYKWLVQIAVCVHWFNPFVYLLAKQVNRTCELSCDEAVILTLGDKTKREYGDMLISFAKAHNQYKSSLVSVTLTEGAEQLKERLGAIMNLNKKSIFVKVITILLTGVLCICFSVSGAYAAPMTWKGSGITDKTLTEDGVYYIFCDGASPIDKPQACVSDGSVMFVLVRKDSYTSVGPFEHMQTLIQDVTKQCESMDTLTQEEKGFVINKAKEIAVPASSEQTVLEIPEQEERVKEYEVSASEDENYRFPYMQKGYFYDSYIIELGWNVYDNEYYDQTELILKDGSVMKVYFMDDSKKYIADDRALTSAAGLIFYLKNMNIYPAIEAPLITRMIYTGDQNISALREEFYANGDICGFSALFSLLNQTEREAWYQKIYDADKSAFFSAVMEYMENDLIAEYIDKSERDNKTNFFAMLSGYMQLSDIKHYAEKYYHADNTAWFAVLLDYMTEEEKQQWLVKAQADKKTAFVKILSDEWLYFDF